jgi:hypothetical protein
VHTNCPRPDQKFLKRKDTLTIEVPDAELPETSCCADTKYHQRAIMSSASIPSQPSRCSQNGVSTFIPEMDMSTNWCGTPEQGNLTSMVLQNCCTSDVQSIGGCTLCHTDNPDAEDPTAFLQTFSHCLKKGLEGHNGSTQFASYCNTPNLSSAASLHQSWGVWAFAVLIGISSVIEAFV